MTKALHLGLLTNTNISAVFYAYFRGVYPMCKAIIYFSLIGISPAEKNRQIVLCLLARAKVRIVFGIAIGQKKSPGCDQRLYKISHVYSYCRSS